ncbi:MAG: AraD1 family protein [Acidobacteriaceae bacterium]
MHLVQIARGNERRVAVVREPQLALLRDVHSVLALAQRALAEGRPLTALAEGLLSAEALRYDDVYDGRSEWKLLAPIDVPGDPWRVTVSGTGLTHLGSARDRQAMHEAPTAQQEAQMTDSMRMFEWGRQKGRPPEGTVGIAPEWFYKGDGSMVRGPSAALEIPGYAEDGGEEAEAAAIYVIAEDGTPWRIGMTAGNEFSDHVFERRNYLNLAGSKLRTCSIGPELAVGAEFSDVAGQVRILRGNEVLWEKAIRTGEKNMCHSLANLEHHHFKFAAHRQPGTVHVHFLGADCLSYGEGVRLQAGDVTEVQFENFGRALRNVIVRDEPLTVPLRVRPMQ